jgi:hypothetical protein
LLRELLVGQPISGEIQEMFPIRPVSLRVRSSCMKGSANSSGAAENPRGYRRMNRQVLPGL